MLAWDGLFSNANSGRCLLVQTTNCKDLGLKHLFGRTHT